MDYPLNQVRNARIATHSVVAHDSDLYLDPLIKIEWMRVSQLSESIIFTFKNETIPLLIGDRYKFYQAHYSFRGAYPNPKPEWAGFRLWELW